MDKTKIDLSLITEFRDRVFVMAGCGRYGKYADDETFYDEVEEGFSDDGTVWTAKNGAVLQISDLNYEDHTIDFHRLRHQFPKDTLWRDGGAEIVGYSPSQNLHYVIEDGMCHGSYWMVFVYKPKVPFKTFEEILNTKWMCDESEALICYPCEFME